MRLAGIEDDGGAPGQRDAKARGGKVHVQALVFAKEQVAERGPAVLCAVMVVFCTAARHEIDIAGGERVMQPKRMRPGAHGLQAEIEFGPARARARQGHLLDVSGFQE
ncbi:hypothetical protein D3C85_1170720 [compost metagenome]